MSTRKKKSIRRKQTDRAHEVKRKKRKKGLTPTKSVLLFLLVIGLVFAAAAIFGDRTSGGRVWSEAHQHWHYER